MARFSRLVSPAAVLLGTSIFGNFAAGTEPGKEITAPTAPLTTAEPKVQLPTFAFQTVTTTVSVPDGGTIVNGGKVYSIVPQVQEHLGADGLVRIGIDFDTAPQIISSEEEEDQLLGVAQDEEPDAPSDSIWKTVEQLATTRHATDCPQAKPISETQSLEIEIHPLVEPGLLAVNDAAPLENPEAEFIQLLPAGDDAPTVNPELETSAARVVSPTMSPDEYLAAFSYKIIKQQEPHGLVIPVAHEEPIKAQLPSPMQALGDQNTLCDSHASTCHSFTIQFAPIAQSAPVAEAQAFDGPAQITLHDGQTTSGQGFVWPAQPCGQLTQPAAHTESLDELADRLEREFLRRAVSGQIHIPAECPSDKQVACQEAAACKSGTCQPSLPESLTCHTEKCPAEKCQPCPSNPNTCKPSECQPSQCQSGAFGLAECPGCPVGSPCGECCPAPSSAPSAAFPAYPPRSQWTLPTPAVTFNPYAAGPAACGVPSTFMTQPPMATAQPHAAMGSQHPGSVWTPAPTCSAPTCTAPTCTGPAVCHVLPPAPTKTPVSGEALETHREISRTLEQLAERCESQGLYAQADELRGQAQEFRMRARVIHGHLAALPLPPSFGQMPPQMPPMVYSTTPSYYGQPSLSYPMPANYYPEPTPSLTPAQAPVPATYPQPLPIAQPMMVPRF